MTSAESKYNKLAGKHVLIFGGTSGLGFAVAKSCLAQSARVTVSSSSTSRITAAKRKLTSEFPDAVSRVSGFTCDLSQSSAKAEIESLFNHAQRVDHIVYTAADTLPLIPLQEIKEENYIQAARLRLIAPILVAKVAARFLTPSPESSLTLTSGGIWERPSENWTIVAGIMGGVNSVMRNLALELKPIRVNAVSPGLVDTEMWNATFDEKAKEAAFKAMAEKHLTGRVASADEVAEAYIYLMRDSNVTGRVISTDSGAGIV